MESAVEVGEHAVEVADPDVVEIEDEEASEHAVADASEGEDTSESADAVNVAGQDAVKVAGEVADADEIMPTAFEGALKLTKGWMCSHAKANVRTMKPKLVSQNTNGSEVKTLFSLCRLLPRRRRVLLYRRLRRLRGFSP